MGMRFVVSDNSILRVRLYDTCAEWPPLIGTLGEIPSDNSNAPPESYDQPIGSHGASNLSVECCC